MRIYVQNVAVTEEPYVMPTMNFGGEPEPTKPEFEPCQEENLDMLMPPMTFE